MHNTKVFNARPKSAWQYKNDKEENQHAVRAEMFEAQPAPDNQCSALLN